LCGGAGGTRTRTRGTPKRILSCLLAVHPGVSVCLYAHELGISTSPVFRLVHLRLRALGSEAGSTSRLWKLERDLVIRHLEQAVRSCLPASARSALLRVCRSSLAQACLAPAAWSEATPRSDAWTCCHTSSTRARRRDPQPSLGEGATAPSPMFVAWSGPAPDAASRLLIQEWPQSSQGCRQRPQTSPHRRQRQSRLLDAHGSTVPGQKRAVGDVLCQTGLSHARCRARPITPSVSSVESSCHQDRPG